MNKVHLIGRLTKEIELRALQGSESKVTLFTLAVERKFKNKQGEKDTDFIECEAWNNQANFLSQWTNKGDKIAITGALKVDKYQNKHGENVNRLKVRVEELSLVSKVNKAQTQDNAIDDLSDINDGTFGMSDDDLPF